MSSDRRIAVDFDEPPRTAVEVIWTLGFALAGRLSRRSIDTWSSPGGQRVWVVAPHPDDEASGCGGTIVRHLQRRDQVCVLFVTDGRRSRALGLGPDEMAARRRDEAMASLACLSVSKWDWMGLPEGEWQIDQLTERLTDAAARFAPDVIYAPSRVDFHPEHRRVAHGLASTLSNLPSAPLIRAYQIHVPLTSRLANLRADVTSTRTQADAARRTYVTQADSVVRTRRMRRYASAYHGASGEVEEFWQMSAEAYCIRHRDDPEDWAIDPFRGIRGRELTDPLAYWQGRSARRQLAAAPDRGPSVGRCRARTSTGGPPRLC